MLFEAPWHLATPALLYALTGGWPLALLGQPDTEMPWLAPLPGVHRGGFQGYEDYFQTHVVMGSYHKPE